MAREHSGIAVGMNKGHVRSFSFLIPPVSRSVGRVGLVHFEGRISAGQAVSISEGKLDENYEEEQWVKIPIHLDRPTGFAIT